MGEWIVLDQNVQPIMFTDRGFNFHGTREEAVAAAEVEIAARGGMAVREAVPSPPWVAIWRGTSNGGWGVIRMDTGDYVKMRAASGRLVGPYRIVRVHHPRPPAVAWPELYDPETRRTFGADFRDLVMVHR